jgi:NADH:ubiquinone oxidoreductase subunit K
VNPILMAAALVALGGAVVAVSAREARSVVLAIAVVLLVSPIIADPVAEPVGLAARLLGAILSGYLLWIAARDDTAIRLAHAPTGGSRIGWPAEALVAAAAAVVGLSAHGLGAPAGGPVIASAVGFALAALAVLPVLTGRDVLRVAIGCLLLLDAALVVRTALGGTPGPLEQLLSAFLLVTVAACAAAMGRAARLEAPGGFDYASEAPVRTRRPADAHPLEDDDRSRDAAALRP